MVEEEREVCIADVDVGDEFESVDYDCTSDGGFHGCSSSYEDTIGDTGCVGLRGDSESFKVTYLLNACVLGCENQVSRVRMIQRI